jgi:hypothetical protein
MFMNLSEKVLEALTSNGVATEVIDDYTKKVKGSHSVGKVTAYWVDKFKGQTELSDTVVYLNDVSSDPSAWLWHFHSKVVPHLKATG